MKIFNIILIVLIFISPAAAVEYVTVGVENQIYTELNPSFMSGSDYIVTFNSTTPLPHKFDWRDTGIITPAKDQTLKCGACYAFAMVSAFEGNIAKQTNIKYDLSENHVMNCNWVGSACIGGTALMVANLWSHSGTVLERDDPFYPGFSVCTSAKPAFRVTEWLQISAEKMPQTDTLKRYIMEYGPIYTQLDGMPIPQTRYNGSYVLSALGDTTTNHAVAIIGWDDGYNDINTTGHWFVKNSWGPPWGDEGIGRIGYKRYEIGKYSSVVSKFVPYDSNSREYSHDVAGLTGGIGFKHQNEAQGLAVFNTGSDVIDSVQFWATGTVSDLDILIYDGFNGTDITGNLLYSDKNLHYNEAGIHTIKLKQPVTSPTGKFVLVMNIRVKNSVMAHSKIVPIPIDHSVNRVKNVTFIRNSNSNPYRIQSEWEDTTKISLHGNIVFRLRTNSPRLEPVSQDFAKERIDNVLMSLDTLNQTAEINQIVNITKKSTNKINLITNIELENEFGIISDRISLMNDKSLIDKIIDKIKQIFGVNNE